MTLRVLPSLEKGGGGGGGCEVLSLRKLDSCKMYHTLKLQLVSYVTWTLLHLLKYLQLFAVKSNKDPQNLQKAFEKSSKSKQA